MKVTAPAGSYLWHLLENHPAGAELSPNDDFTFESQALWRRSVLTGVSEGALTGLIELADNNPFVCADKVSTPSPLSTLALIALGPLIRACLPADEIMLQASKSLAVPDLGSLLDELGINQSVTLALDDQDLGSVIALNALVPIEEMPDWSLIDDLFEESYGRSFYVRKAAEWSAAEVSGRPWALYDLRHTPGEDIGLLTVRVMADLRGKAGEAQMIHTFNVMAGYEEHLGIPELLA